MEVILLKDVVKVGKHNDIVDVAAGFAMNNLIPKGLAKVATPGARKAHALTKEKAQAAQALNRAEVAQAVQKLDGQKITIVRKANEKGHLFAALSVDDVIAEIQAQHGGMLSSSVFEKYEPIKEVGEHAIHLVSDDTKGTLTVVVEAEQ